MANLLEDVYLTSDPLNVALVLNAIFLEDFDGNFFACDRVGANPDLAKGARAE